MNSIERAITKLSNLVTRCETHHTTEEIIRADVVEESLCLSRLDFIDQEEKRYRELQRDGRRAIRFGCE